MSIDVFPSVVLENNNNIYKKLLKELGKEITKKLVKEKDNIQREIRNVLDFKLDFSNIPLPVIGELGSPIFYQVMEKAKRIWVDSLIVKIIPIRVRALSLMGGLNIVGVRSDYRDVLNIPGSEFISESGFDIPWLRWMLVDGDDAVIANYRFVLGGPNSRTGIGSMARSNFGWALTNEYAGDITNNIVIERLRNIEDDITKIVERRLQ